MSHASLEDFERFKRETARSYPLGALQMNATRDARRAFYKVRKLLAQARSARDPYAPTAYLEAATTEPLRFHWAVQKARAAYRETRLHGKRVARNADRLVRPKSPNAHATSTASTRK